MTVKHRRTPGRTRSDSHVQPQSASLNCKKNGEMREKCSWSLQQYLEKYIGKIVMHSIYRIIIGKFCNNECYIKPYQKYKEK